MTVTNNTNAFQIPGAQVGALLLHTIGRTARAAIPSCAHKASSFKDHAQYQTILKMRVMGDTFGVADPFFQVHDGRNGAMTTIDGVEYLNYGSYDYLGLNVEPLVAAAAKAAVDTYGTSVSASRLVAGERQLHRDLERALADFYGAEDAITFVSGHATNVSTVSTLMAPGDLIIHDELMHNSGIVGAKLSGATIKGFAHNNVDALEALLEEHRGNYKNVLILIEGVYSMDGDTSDLPAIIELKNRFGCWLMVDEAHSLGVLGKTGRGVAEHFGLAMHQVDIWMGTLSKTLASCGGYVCGSKELVSILKYRAAGFVFAAGLPAPAAAAALAALQVLKAQPERCEVLRANGQLFIAECKKAGLNTGPSQGYAVVPVIVGDMIKTAKLTERLQARGINALPILPPAVAVKSSRVRFFMSALHTPEQIKETVRIIAEEYKVLMSFGGAFKRVANAR